MLIPKLFLDWLLCVLIMRFGQGCVYLMVVGSQTYKHKLAPQSGSSWMVATTMPYAIKCRLQIIQSLDEMHLNSILVKDIEQGSKLVHLACRFESSENVKTHFVEKPGAAMVLTLDNNRCTPLHIACRHALS